LILQKRTDCHTGFYRIDQFKVEFQLPVCRQWQQAERLATELQGGAFERQLHLRLQPLNCWELVALVASL